MQSSEFKTFFINGLTHHYLLDKSIFILGVSGVLDFSLKLLPIGNPKLAIHSFKQELFPMVLVILK